MQGYPYQRLASPAGAAPPSPQDVGQMLVQRGAAAGASPMAEMMGAPELPNAGTMPSAMGGGMAGAAPMGDPMLGAVQAARIRAQGTDGDYDPATEHSVSSTRVAMSHAIRASQGRMQGSEQRVSNPLIDIVLARGGIPPLEVQLMKQSGVLGDTTDVG